MKKRIFLICFVLLLISVFSVSCNLSRSDETKEKESPERQVVDEEQTKSEFILDTIITINIFEGPKLTEDEWNEIFNIVRKIDSTMSSHNEDSEVSVLNSSAGKDRVIISENTFIVLDEALKIAKKTEGKFEPTIGALSKLWGIGTENEKVPSLNEIESAKEKVSFNELSLETEKNVNEGYTYYAKLKSEGNSVDVGGIAKGYSADLVKEELKRIGVKRAILDFGGNILVIGQKSDDRKWKIGIQNPFNDRGEPYAAVMISDESLVTSGDYERFFELNGKRYHHIIDPETGYPTENELRSASIISKSSMMADAYATACMVLGLEGAKKLVESTDEVEAVFILKDGSNVTVLKNDREFEKLK